METMDAGWLETLLKKHSGERSVARVLGVEMSKALGPGENYTSDIVRIKMKVVLGSGRVAQRAIIVKKMNEEAAAIVIHNNLFTTEIEVYSNIIPLIEELMEEHGDHRDYIWADYFGTTGDMLIFNDLQREGFKLANRLCGQDLDHALLTLKNLARFHGMTSALLRRNAIRGNQLNDSFLARNDKLANKFFSGGVHTLADTIISAWDSKWHGMAHRLRAIADILGSKMQELYNEKNVKFKVINHGDCWINNVLFKYEPNSRHPVALRFVDYQTSHYNSYGWDLVYFFHSSIVFSVRKNHHELLVSSYQSTLSSTLEFYNCPGDEAPTVEEVGSEIERLLHVGLAVSSTLLPVTMAVTADTLDLSNAFDDSVPTMHNRNLYLNKKYTEVIKNDLEYFASKGVL